MIRRRGGRYYFDSTIGGERNRCSLGVSDRKAAVALANQVVVAMASGPKSDVWPELKQVLPPNSYLCLTAHRNVAASPELSIFQTRFEDRLDRRVKLGELAEGSRALYVKTADVFFKRMAEVGVREMDGVTPEAVERYLVWRRDSILTRGGNGNGIKADYTTLAAIFNFAVEEGAITKSPLKGKYQTDADGPGAQPFTPEELKRLNGAATVEELLPFLLLRDTGLRGSDAVAVTWDAVDLTGKKTLVWQTKKRKVTVRVPLYGDLLLMLLIEYAKVVPSKEPILGGMTRAKLYKMMANLGKRAGVEDCHPHRFRCTLACTMLERGASLFDVAALLGDSQAVVEKFYAATTDKQQERVRNILEATVQIQEGVVA